MAKQARKKSKIKKVNLSLLSQALRVYGDRRHLGLAKTKTRSEVAISRRKIYRQKGTGGARHGAKSAPIFVGGGVTHGPKGVKRVLTLPKKMAKKALAEAVALKIEKGEVSTVLGLKSVSKTKAAGIIIGKRIKNNQKATLVLEKGNWLASRAFRNLNRVTVLPLESLSVYDVYYGGHLLVDSKSAEALGIKTEKKK